MAINQGVYFSNDDDNDDDDDDEKERDVRYFFSDVFHHVHLIKFINIHRHLFSS